MELLQKLIKDRGTGVSDKEFGIMSGKQEGKGYQSFIDKNRFGDAEGSSYTPREMQTIDPLANTTPYGNATTPALTKMRDMQGMGGGITNSGAMSNKELQNFKIGASYVDDNALGGYVAHNMPNLTRMGVGNFDLNLPPRELRKQIQTLGQPTGEGVPNPLYGSNYYAGRGMQDMGYHPKTLGGKQPSYMNAMSSNVGDGAIQKGMMRGVASDVDTMFAKTLGELPPREQAEIISVTQGYTDEQVDNFKRQYLRGKVSPYELEVQSNLGF